MTERLSVSHLRSSSPDLSLGTRIDLDDLAKRYLVGETTVTALSDVNLHVDETAFVVVLGPSGSGKTTLLNMIGLLDVPTEGRVALAGRDMTRASRREQFALRRHTVSFIFQTFNLFPGLTAAENVAVPLLVQGTPRARALVAARDTLAKVGLGERTEAVPDQLSGGQQQRVAIARALVHRPHLIVCDEPTSALDHRTGHDLIALMKSVVLEGDRSLIIVTHDARIFEFADRIAEMDDGRIVALREPDAGPIAFRPGSEPRPPAS